MPEVFRKKLGTNSVSLKVIIPWTGEPQIFSSIERVKGFVTDSGFGIELVILSGFGNREVHQLIYDEVGKDSVNTIKLDGDMCIENFDLLSEHLLQLGSDEVAIFPVYCWILRRNVYGIHLFGKDVSGIEAGEEPFPDQYEWERTTFYPLAVQAAVSHCRTPSDDQVDNYIGHRLRKIYLSWFLRIEYIPLVIRAIVKNPSSLMRIKNILNICVRDQYKILVSSHEKVIGIDLIKDQFRDSIND